MAEKIDIINIGGIQYEFPSVDEAKTARVYEDDSGDSLNFSDPEGNVVASFGKGHLKTQKFNSAELGVDSATDNSDNDLDFSDKNGNVVLSIKGGHLKTKNFNSAEIGVDNYWKGKSIWWCGTSIPAGSDATLGSEETIAGMYPKQVGVNLSATVLNEAVGGSMCRANVRTGDYNGVNPSNLTSCLSRTKAEIEDLITNYDTYKALSGNTSWPSSLSTSDINRLRSSSFEDKLLPYLVGEVTTKNPKGLIPDLFVIDHGHNDFKYKLANDTTDIELEPTVENITNNILAEDTYMTANNYERLAYFLNIRDANNPNVGDGSKLIQRVGNDNIASFAASLNRNCYIGAINFIVTVILCWKPKARFVFVSNYEYENGHWKLYAPLIDAQESIAKSWAFPLCEVYKYLGFSDHIVPTAKEYFQVLYADTPPAKIPSAATNCINNNVGCNVFQLYNQDNVHPHSDISGDANKVYAGVLSEFIKTCR